MEPWVAVAVRNAREHTRFPAREEPRLLGVIPLVGRAKVVGLAYQSYIPPLQYATIINTAIIAPAPRHYYQRTKEEWYFYEGMSTDSTTSPSATISYVYRSFCGVWWLLGLGKKTSIMRITVSTDDKRVFTPDIRNNGFMLMLEEDLSPLWIEVISAEDVVLESFTLTLPYMTGSAQT
jgi:hypothetical protein